MTRNTVNRSYLEKCSLTKFYLTIHINVITHSPTFVRPDLGSNCLTLWWYSKKVVFEISADGKFTQWALKTIRTVKCEFCEN